MISRYAYRSYPSSNLNLSSSQANSPKESKFLFDFCKSKILIFLYSSKYDTSSCSSEIYFNFSKSILLSELIKVRFRCLFKAIFSLISLWAFSNNFLLRASKSFKTLCFALTKATYTLLYISRRFLYLFSYFWSERLFLMDKFLSVVTGYSGVSLVIYSSLYKLKVFSVSKKRNSLLVSFYLHCFFLKWNNSSFLKRNLSGSIVNLFDT